MTIRNRIIAVGLGLTLLGTTLAAQAFSGEQYTKEAKISSTTARATALKAFHGKIVKENWYMGVAVAVCATTSTSVMATSPTMYGWTPRRVSF